MPFIKRTAQGVSCIMFLCMRLGVMLVQSLVSSSLLLSKKFSRVLSRLLCFLKNLFSAAAFLDAGSFRGKKIRKNDFFEFCKHMLTFLGSGTYYIPING